MSIEQVLNQLKELGDPVAVAGMQRFGINAQTALGIKLPVLRDYARQYKKEHDLALELWQTDIHEARLLAAFIADPKKVTESLMEEWVKDFNSWDICDQVCSSLFDKTPYAYSKAIEWTSRQEEYQKRAGFAMMAVLAVHDKNADDSKFIQFFPLIEAASDDNRNFVKKAVNWALRQIGKRNLNLNKFAIEVAERLKQFDHKSAKWIAADALRELESEAVQARLRVESKKLKVKS